MIKLKKIPITNRLFGFLSKTNKNCAKSEYCNDCKYLPLMTDHCIFDISSQWADVYKEKPTEFEESIKIVSPIFIDYATNCSLMCKNEKACVCKIMSDYGICPSRIETWNIKEDIWKHRAAVRNLIINKRRI